jgi:hypothetical protein
MVPCTLVEGKEDVKAFLLGESEKFTVAPSCKTSFGYRAAIVT